MKKRINLGLGALTLTVCALDAGAQVRLDRYSAPVSPNDGLRLSRPLAFGHQQLGGLLAVDYADDPLVLELERGLEQTETTQLVELQLQGHARFAYGLVDRLVLGVGFDFAMVQTGQGYADRATSTVIAPDDGSGLGDAQVGARYVALGSAEELMALAVGTNVVLPLARGANSDQNLSGERGIAINPELLFEVRPGHGRVTANLGAIVRENSRLLGTVLGDELTFGLGGAVQLPGDLKRFEALAEVYGSTATADVFGSAVTPVEALLGGRWAPSDRWRVSLAGGTGIVRGLGSPDVRALASIGMIAAPDGDDDNDTIFDQYDSCSSDPEDLDGFQDNDGCPDPDDDADGVLDSVDRCQTEPEDRDGFSDEDGCADLDNDGDGIADTADGCATEPEDVDGDRDGDGCPDVETDGDKDGIADAADRCADAAEDVDQFEDDDGCPDTDNDGDGVPDTSDRCPLEAGVPKEGGCPQVRVEGGHIRIDERIEFAQGGAEILAASEPLMEQIRALLERNPELRVLAIEGHTDSKGSAAFNQKLSERRAQSVARWLIEHGIAGTRLTAFGCGHQRPLEPDVSPEAQQRNRRVEMHVIDPPSAEPHSTTGCRQAPLTLP